jgi:uncharacterized membrane protein YqhA
MKVLEQFFERILWGSRHVVLIAVIASLLVAFGAFYMATVDVIHLLSQLVPYVSPNLSEQARSALRADTVTYIVKAVDGYLIAAIMLIFALGLYELFINKIDVAQNTEAGERVLLIRSLDDLKDRLAKLILLVLVIEFFQQALKLHYKSALELLYLGIGILFIGAALYLSGQKGAKSH